MLFVFGESEKGPLCRPTFCREPLELFNYFGHSLEATSGFYLAIQSLLYKRPCIFFRVKNEGFSRPDYLKGLHILKSDLAKLEISALGVPGLSDPEIFDELERHCQIRRSILIFEQKDLIDYLSF